MKTIALLFVLFALPMTTYADRKGNGGDICEDKIQLVRSDLEAWINNNGPATLLLPNGVNLSEYKTKMIGSISSANVSCTDSNIRVGPNEKTCKNFFDDKGVPQIICNRLRFLQTSVTDRYVLIHHEYAGIAQLEKNEGAVSNYTLSNQISEYLNSQHRLAVEKTVCSARYTSDDDIYHPVVVAELVDRIASEIPGKNRNITAAFFDDEIRLSLGSGHLLLSAIRIPKPGGHPFWASLEYMNLSTKAEELISIDCHQTTFTRTRK